MAACIAFPEDHLHVSLLLLAVLWGLHRRIPARLMLLYSFYPPAWPVLLIGFGVRKKMVGRADLFALAIIGFLFPFSAVITSLLGFDVWRRWWIRRGNCGLIPALPGLFLGLATYCLFQLGVSHFLSV